MKEDDIKKMFDNSAKVTPDPQARQRAIAAAMAEFTAGDAGEREKILASDQGINEQSRPTDINEHSRNKTMKKSTRNWAFGSLVAASVLMFASFIALRTPNQFDLELDPIEVIRNDRQQVINEANEEGVGRKNEALAEEIIVTASRSNDAGRQPAPASLSKELVKQPAVKHDSKAIAPQEQELALSDVVSHAESTAMAGKDSRNKKLSRIGSTPRANSFAAPESKIIMPPRPRPESMPAPIANSDRERFEKHEINPLKLTKEEPVSTFSIDVDTSSYSFVRRKLNRGALPASEAVRVEEFINYFDYAYPNDATKNKPFATHVLVGDSPWKAGNKLLHIGIKGYDIKNQPKSNLVFLLDVSGSMSSEDKLPLVKQSVSLLLDTLRPDDTIAIAVYAGAAGTVLEPTEVKEKQKILSALNKLRAGGSTAGAAGIELAYQLAEENFKEDAVNRIVLATDGDFNVGISDPDRLKKYVERKREKGIFLSVLGFGEGNYYDQMMQSLAQNGNGVAAYIDSLSEAQKVLVTEATSSLFPIAKDVKIQVEFNPATVAEYRLIGYETRHLKREDFNNDKVDAGDIGSGHTVTAIYEITPTDSQSRLIDEHRYAKKSTPDGNQNEYALLKLRYKLPKENSSNLITQIIPARNTLTTNDKVSTWQQREFLFSAAVAGFAQLLKDDKYMGSWNYDSVIEAALASRGNDEYGYRNEFVQIVRKAKIAKGP